MNRNHNHHDHFAGADHHTVGGVYGRAVTIYPREEDTVNEETNLVPWSGQDVLVDRYDARLLLEPLDIRPSKRTRNQPPPSNEPSEEELDRERYRDLYAPAPPSPDTDNGGDGGTEYKNWKSASGCAEGSREDIEGYAAIPFTYDPDPAAEARAESASDTQEEEGEEPVAEPHASDWEREEAPFLPAFSLPAHLRTRPQPATQRAFDIMLATARHIKKGGIQLEIVLRVKQADSPQFGFLMPTHPLHPFFRWLVEVEESALKGVEPAPEVGMGDEIGGGGVSALASAPAVRHVHAETAAAPASAANDDDDAVAEAALARLGEYGDDDDTPLTVHTTSSTPRETAACPSATLLPPDQHAAMTKLLGFISRSGPPFEALVRDRERGNPLFGFMWRGDPGFGMYKAALVGVLGEAAAEELLQGAIDDRVDGQKGAAKDGAVEQPPWLRGRGGSQQAAQKEQEEQQQPAGCETSEKEALSKTVTIAAVEEGQQTSAPAVVEVDSEVEAKQAERRRRAQELLGNRRRAAFVKATEARQVQLSTINTHKRIFLDDD